MKYDTKCILCLYEGLQTDLKICSKLYLVYLQQKCVHNLLLVKINTLYLKSFLFF